MIHKVGLARVSIPPSIACREAGFALQDQKDVESLKSLAYNSLNMAFEIGQQGRIDAVVKADGRGTVTSP